MKEGTAILTDSYFQKLTFEAQFNFLERKIRQHGKSLNIKIPFSTKKRRTIIFKNITTEKKRRIIENVAIYQKILEDMADPKIRAQVDQEFKAYLKECRESGSQHPKQIFRTQTSSSNSVSGILR